MNSYLFAASTFFFVSKDNDDDDGGDGDDVAGKLRLYQSYLMPGKEKKKRGIGFGRGG